MTTTTTLILGASDPEMIAIEELGHQVGAEIRYALSARGVRVRADEAYQTVAIAARLHMDRRSMDAPLPPDGTVYAVECDGPAIPPNAIRIDHHRPGDPGYGRPPAEFLPASSIGQVIAELARIGRLPWPMRSTDYCPTAAGVQYAVADWADAPWEVWIVSGRASSIEEGGAPWAPMPPHIVLTAAADHCLAAAYRGECPGVDPDELIRWERSQRRQPGTLPVSARRGRDRAARARV